MQVFVLCDVVFSMNLQGLSALIGANGRPGWGQRAGNRLWCFFFRLWCVGAQFNLNALIRSLFQSEFLVIICQSKNSTSNLFAPCSDDVLVFVFVFFSFFGWTMKYYRTGDGVQCAHKNCMDKKDFDPWLAWRPDWCHVTNFFHGRWLTRFHKIHLHNTSDLPMRCNALYTDTCDKSETSLSCFESYLSKVSDLEITYVTSRSFSWWWHHFFKCIKR